MKRLILVMAAAGLLIATPSCKKGENDPGLSLKSRKARLAGEYNLDSWMNTWSETDPDGDKYEVTTTITGSTGTTTMVSTIVGDGTVTMTRNIKVDKASFSFTKDGTYEMTMNTTTTYTEPGDGFFVDNIMYTVVETMTESGNWSFLGGENDDFKKKERVILNTLNMVSTSQTTSVTTYEDSSNDTNVGILTSNTLVFDQGEESAVFEIDMLKKKEMVFKQSTNGSAVNTYTEDGTAVSYSSSNTGSTEIKLSEG